MRDVGAPCTVLSICTFKTVIKNKVFTHPTVVNTEVALFPHYRNPIASLPKRSHTSGPPGLGLAYRELKHRAE